MSPQPEAAARGRGRPRSQEAHRAILTATLELLGAQGFRGLTIEGVAEHAGVGKTTIYRRWPSKTELVAEAIGQMRPPSAPPDSGSLEGDLRGLMRVQQERVGTTPGLRRLIPVLLTEATQDPAFLTLVTEGVIEPIRDVLRELIRRGIERGELRPDVDVGGTRGPAARRARLPDPAGRRRHLEGRRRALPRGAAAARRRRRPY